MLTLRDTRVVLGGGSSAAWCYDVAPVFCSFPVFQLIDFCEESLLTSDQLPGPSPRLHSSVSTSPPETPPPQHNCGSAGFYAASSSLSWHFFPVLFSLCPNRHGTGGDQKIQSTSNISPKNEVSPVFTGDALRAFLSCLGGRSDPLFPRRGEGNTTIVTSMRTLPVSWNPFPSPRHCWYLEIPSFPLDSVANLEFHPFP